MKIFIRGRKVILPYLSRVRNRASAFKAYCALYIDPFTRVSRTTFYQVMSFLTRTQVKSLRAIDYYITDLLHESMRRIIELINDVFGTNNADGKKLITHLRTVYKAIQHSHRKWLSLKDDCQVPSSSARFALGHPEFTSAKEVDKNMLSIMRFFVVVLPNSHPDMKKYDPIFEYSWEKAVLFMGHSMRVQGQHSRITDIKLMTSIRCIMIIGDYMMYNRPSLHNAPFCVL